MKIGKTMIKKCLLLSVLIVSLTACSNEQADDHKEKKIKKTQTPYNKAKADAEAIVKEAEKRTDKINEALEQKDKDN